MLVRAFRGFFALGHQQQQQAARAAAMADPNVELFRRIGLDQVTAQNAVRNGKLTSNLVAVIQEAGVTSGCEKSVGNLLYTIATQYPAKPVALKHRPKFLSFVTSGQLKSGQLDAAFNYLGDEPEVFDEEEFKARCGIGVLVSQEDIEIAADEVLKKNRAKLLEDRYRTNVGVLVAQIRELQPFAEFATMKAVLDKKMEELLGPKTAADEVKKKKKAKPEEAKKVQEAPPEEETNPFAFFPPPEANTNPHVEIRFSDKSVLTPANSKEKLKEHLRKTGGKVLTRFPPEPNGYLHIGHAKAMFVDFGLAEDRHGDCYLRFDDTNPEAEKKEYIDHIQEIVSWMGWKPFKVTYSSDYFGELYNLAVDLIKRGGAYVDEQTAEEVREYRQKHLESPWRDRPIEESLRLFEEMRDGKHPEGRYTLRMKQDMKNENYNMMDLVAYRIKHASHPHTKDRWKIYPTYDYTHCIVDSLENVTHSLCTLEFEVRRVSYYWLLHKLDLYLPYVWEYSRLNMSHNVLSKRKLNKLVTQNMVDGWDDPRLLTLAGLRRRGVTPTAINAFCRGLGITRSDNLISVDRLEHYIRDELNRTAPRTMVVLRPLKVVIQDLDPDFVEEVEAKKMPDAQAGDPSSTYKIPFTRVVYIERSDFRLQDSKDYYGLAKGKTVLLRYAYPITCVDYKVDDNNVVVELLATCNRKKGAKPPKGVLHWVPGPVSGKEPLKVELRLFDKLFKSEVPGEVKPANPNEPVKENDKAEEDKEEEDDKEEWLKDLNPESKLVVKDAVALDNLQGVKPGDTFQFERTGYFCVDPDSTPDKIVFNRTVTLRSSY